MCSIDKRRPIQGLKCQPDKVVKDFQYLKHFQMPQNIHCKLPQHLAQLAVASITAESYRSLKISKASNLSARGKKASVFLHIDVEK